MSPRHYLKYIEGEFVRTPQMLLGSAVDIMLLTPKESDNKIVVMPDLNLRLKADRATRDEFILNNKGRLVITDEQMETALLAVKSVYNDTDAMYYLERIVNTQVPMLWTDKASGLKTKGFVDGESDGLDKDYFIMDLKTAASAEQNAFVRQAYQMDYHLQAGGYTLGYRLQKFMFPDYINLVVETTAPFGVNVFRADNRYIEKAQSEYLNTLLAFKYCLDNKEFNKTYNFHRFSTKYHRMELPGYAKTVFG